jgi:hypothetical protein
MKKTLCTLSMICGALIGQSQVIPNGNFETWAGGEPLFWTTNNNITSYQGGLPVMGLSPAPEGDSCINLNVRLLTTFPIGVPAIATSMFATTMKPLSFEGYYKQTAMISTDSTLARVLFTKWDTITMTQITIGQATIRSIGEMNDWTSFSVPLSYYSDSNPDSCRIVISAFGQGNSSSSFDNLRLTLTSSVEDQSIQNFDWMVYPNPTSENLTLSLAALGFLGETQLEIYAIDGQLVHSEKLTNAITPTVDVSHLTNGQYELALRNGNRRLAKTFVKN